MSVVSFALAVVFIIFIANLAKHQQTRGHGGHSGAAPLQIFLFPPNFVVHRKIRFKHITKKNLAPLKMYFAPQNLQPGYGPEYQQQVEHVTASERDWPSSDGSERFSNELFHLDLASECKAASLGEGRSSETTMK